MSNGSPVPVSPKDLNQVVGGWNEQSGGAGNDTLTGGDGADKLMGSNTWGTDSNGAGQPINSGNDVLSGGGGADELHGGDGDDHLRGGTGDGDLVFGGDGNDTLWWRVGDGNDQLHGGNGTDNINIEGASVQQVLAGLQLYQGSYTVSGNAIVFNGTANGQFTIGGQTVQFFGIEQLSMPDNTTAPTNPDPNPTPTGNPNVINGTGGADNLAGSNTWGAGSDGSWQPINSGNDTFNAGNGNDTALGGDGNDVFNMGRGDDKAFGGDGNDTFNWARGDGNDEFHGGAGRDTVVFTNATLNQAQIAMYDGGSYRVDGNTIIFNGSSSGQVTIGGQVVKFFGMERMTFNG